MTEPAKPSVLEVLLLVQSDRSVGHLSDYTQNALAAAVNALTKPADSPASEAVCGCGCDPLEHESPVTNKLVACYKHNWCAVKQ